MEKEQQDLFVVSVLGRDYKIKCPPNKQSELKNSAQYLNDKMQQIQSNADVMSLDKVAVIAALNISHELLNTKHQSDTYITEIGKRIQSIQGRVDSALEEAG